MKEIGKGATKTVYLSSFNGRPVAVNTLLDPYEVSMLKEVEGIPNCLKLIDVTEDSFLTEYCDRGTLMQEMLHPSLPLEDITRIAFELILCLKTLHAKGLIHRDFRPHNVFLTGTPVRVVLGDFGKTCRVDDLERRKEIFHNDFFISPEKARVALLPDAEREPLWQAATTQKEDLWSLGVLLHTLFRLGPLPHHVPSDPKIQRDIVLILRTATLTDEILAPAIKRFLFPSLLQVDPEKRRLP